MPLHRIRSEVSKMMERPELRIIAAGSLLGVTLKAEGISFPVGEVDRIDMYPMSFEEFVRADGGGKYLDGLKKLPLVREIPELYTVPLEKYLKNYYSERQKYFVVHYKASGGCARIL